jgi:hypothetical protein
MLILTKNKLEPVWPQIQNRIRNRLVAPDLILPIEAPLQNLIWDQITNRVGSWGLPDQIYNNYIDNI